MASKGLVTWVPEHSKKENGEGIRETPGESGSGVVGGSANGPGRPIFYEGEMRRGEGLKRGSDGSSVITGKGEVLWQGNLVREDSIVQPKDVFYSKFSQKGANQPREVVWNGKEFVAKQVRVKIYRTEDEETLNENELVPIEEEQKPKVIKYKNILNSYNKVSI